MAFEIQLLPTDSVRVAPENLKRCTAYGNYAVDRSPSNLA